MTDRFLKKKNSEPNKAVDGFSQKEVIYFSMVSVKKKMDKVTIVLLNLKN